MIFALNSHFQLAFNILEKGGIIILPTDTLYGFSCDASNDLAIRKLNKLKGRKEPLSIIVSDIEMAMHFLHMDADQCCILEEHFPGPFTFLLKKKADRLAPKVTLNSEKIAIRIPNHPKSIELVNKLKRPIVTTSVNKTGLSALKNTKTMLSEFPGIPVFEDKSKRISNGSTIVDLTTSPYAVIRQGDGKWLYK